jgi:hypothetical protein
MPFAHVIEAAQDRTLTVGQLRQLMHLLPDDSNVLVDGQNVKVATDYAGILYMDTGLGLPMPCPACGYYGCNCHEKWEEDR